MGICASQPEPPHGVTKTKPSRSHLSTTHTSPSTQQSTSKPLSSSIPRQRPASVNAYQEFADATPLLTGKVAVVTGSTGGPLLVASTLVRKGAYVILVTTSSTDRSSRMKIIETAMADAAQEYVRDVAHRSAATECTLLAAGRPTSSPQWLQGAALEATPSSPSGSAGTSAAGASTDTPPPRPWGTSGRIPAADAAAAGAIRPTTPSPLAQRRGVGRSGIAAAFTGRRGSPPSPTADAAPGDAVHVRVRSPATPEAHLRQPLAAAGRRGGSDRGTEEGPFAGARPEPDSGVAPWPSDGFSVVTTNFQDLQSVRDGALAVLRILRDDLGGRGVDLLVNLAEDRPRSETSKHLSADGYDVQVQANAISHFLFTRLLMPALQIAAGARGKARIVNCTSAGREALAADVPAECFARHGAAAKAGGAKGAVAAGDGGARANAYGVVPAVAVAEERAQRRRPQRGGGGYCDVRERRQQSRKANLVFSMALRDLLGFSRSNIVVAVAITGPHVGLSAAAADDPAAAPAAGDGADGGRGTAAGQYAIAARHSTMDVWMPVLACACLHDVHSGDIFVAGPRRQNGARAVGVPGVAPAEHDVGSPEKITLEGLGVAIDEGLAGVVWEGCQKAAAPFLPGKTRK